MGEMITRKDLAIRPVSPSYHGDRALQCRRPDLRSRLTPLQSWQLLHAWHASGSNDTLAGPPTNMISGPAKTELTTAKADKISKKRIEETVVKEGIVYDIPKERRDLRRRK
jgi:hypothetical protein